MIFLMTDKKKMGGPFFGNWLIHVALILILTGAFFANFTFAQLKKASSFDNWPAVEATVIDSVSEKTSAVQSMMGQDYQKVTCQFSAKGLVVHSFFRTAGRKYHNGEKVQLRFDPLAPQHSVLNPGSNGAISLSSSLGFAFFTISGASLLVFALKQKKKNLNPTD